MKGLGKTDVLNAIRRLGELALTEETEVELCIYGGCAMMLAFDRRAITKDIDAVFKPREKVLEWAAIVAREQNLPEDWLNDDVKQFLAPIGAARSLPIELQGVRITMPTASYLLAMKALAARRALPGYAGDEEDLRFLIRKLEIRNPQDVQQHIDRYYPDDVLKPAAEALIARIIKEEKP